MQVITPSAGARHVDTSRGAHSTLLNSEWMKRSDDERYLNLDDLYKSVLRRSDKTEQRVVPIRSLRPSDNGGQPLIETDRGTLRANHWSFGQFCARVGAPADYIRTLPSHLAAENLAHGINKRPGDVQIYDDGEILRAVTGPKYGRIHDHKIVGAIKSMVENSETFWKVPGVMNWSTGQYDPNIPVSKETTTLFASDRDVALFLCDDQTPIEVGKLANGDPDLMFRGFFSKNSEVGDGSLYAATMYLRGVCANRCLWGLEGFRDIRIRHTRNAPYRMIREVQPVLESYKRKGDPMRVVAGVREAKAQNVITTMPWSDPDTARDEQLVFLTKKMGFSKDMAEAILKHDAPGTDRDQLVNVWDFVGQISNFAQKSKHHDRRLFIEGKASELLNRATASV